MKVKDHLKSLFLIPLYSKHFLFALWRHHLCHFKWEKRKSSSKSRQESVFLSCKRIGVPVTGIAVNIPFFLTFVSWNVRSWTPLTPSISHLPNLLLRESFSCQLTLALSIPSFNLPWSYIHDTTFPKETDSTSFELSRSSGCQVQRLAWWLRWLANHNQRKFAAALAFSWEVKFALGECWPIDLKEGGRSHSF